MQCKNIAGRFFGLVTKHACDRRTDRQNYDSQHCASVAASRGKNTPFCQNQSGRLSLYGNTAKPVFLQLLDDTVLTLQLVQ